MTGKQNKNCENPADQTDRELATSPPDSSSVIDETGPQAQPSITILDTRPAIETSRLVLRPLLHEDAVQIQKLVNHRDVAATCYSLNYPYPDGLAETWIAAHAELWNSGKSVVFGIDRKPDSTNEGDRPPGLIGVIGLEITPADERAELGYWLGVDFWNQGYATEAAQAVVEFGFESLGLHRIYARHFSGNVASGRVMQKIGMHYEGLLREHVRKWGRFKDVICYGLVRPQARDSDE